MIMSCFALILVFSLTLVSAGLFNDFFGKMTWKVTVIIGSDGWTDWVSIDRPSGMGDYESRSSITGLCENPTEIECRVVDTKEDYSQTGQVVTCTLDTGLLCKNLDNSGVCLDYEVRFKCPIPEAKSDLVIKDIIFRYGADQVSNDNNIPGNSPFTASPVIQNIGNSDVDLRNAKISFKIGEINDQGTYVEETSYTTYDYCIKDLGLEDSDYILSPSEEIECGFGAGYPIEGLFYLPYELPIIENLKTYRVDSTIDYDEEISEINEENNNYLEEIYIEGPPTGPGCEDLEAVWPTGGTREPYSYETDLCTGYRCLNGNEIDPSCSNPNQCLETCEYRCVNIPKAKERCANLETPTECTEDNCDGVCLDIEDVCVECLVDSDCDNLDEGSCNTDNICSYPTPTPPPEDEDSLPNNCYDCTDESYNWCKNSNNGDFCTNSPADDCKGDNAEVISYKDDCVEDVPPSTEPAACEGCSLDNKCYPYNNRKSGNYCGLEGEFISQQEKETACENNFECQSNLCLEEECISGSFMKRILEWFRNLFGGN